MPKRRPGLAIDTNWAGKLESLDVSGEALRYGFSRLSEVLWSIPMCSVLASRVLLQVVLQALRKFLRPGKLIMVVDVSHGGDGIGNEPIVVHIEHGARVGVSGRDRKSTRLNSSH